MAKMERKGSDKKHKASRSAQGKQRQERRDGWTTRRRQVAPPPYVSPHYLCCPRLVSRSAVTRLIKCSHGSVWVTQATSGHRVCTSPLYSSSRRRVANHVTVQSSATGAGGASLVLALARAPSATVGTHMCPWQAHLHNSCCCIRRMNINGVGSSRYPAQPTTCWARGDTKAERLNPSSSATQPYQGMPMSPSNRQASCILSVNGRLWQFSDTWARD
ncbi:hypothetical protein HaLaN_28817, partial [Haematococcus lacustris]